MFFFFFAVLPSFNRFTKPARSSNNRLGLAVDGMGKWPPKNRIDPEVLPARPKQLVNSTNRCPCSNQWPFNIGWLVNRRDTPKRTTNGYMVPNRSLYYSQKDIIGPCSQECIPQQTPLTCVSQPFASRCAGPGWVNIRRTGGAFRLPQEQACGSAARGGWDPDTLHPFLAGRTNATPNWSPEINHPN